MKLKHLIGGVVMSLAVTSATSQTLNELLVNPYWSVDMYKTGYCEFRHMWLKYADDNEITYSSTDVDLEVWLREEFDATIDLVRVVVVGDRPDTNVFICNR